MQNGQLTLGSGRIVSRTRHAANWRQILLDEMPGSTLEHFEGRPYVQLPSLPAMGPAPVRMRSPDPRTLIYRVGTKPDPQGKKPRKNSCGRSLTIRRAHVRGRCLACRRWRSGDRGL